MAEYEPLSDQRMARLRANNEPVGDHLSGLTADEVAELLGEVDRARAELVAATARAEKAEAEIRRLKTVALNAIETEKHLARERIADELNRAAELGYPANAAWVQNLHQAARIARNGLDAWFAANERRPDGSRKDGRRQPWEPIHNEQDLAGLTAAPEDRLSGEQAAAFDAALRDARGNEAEDGGGRD